uniref:cyclin-dependent kinase n=1 Tax=Haemonchus contortus TaxID=6289 RepID=A0A7I4Y4L6_HAECO
MSNYGSPDDGELTDDSHVHQENSAPSQRSSSSSPNQMPEPSIERKKIEFNKVDIESEEDRLRRRLLEKRERDARHSEDEEMFTIQPKKPKSDKQDKSRDRHRDRDRREREREREGDKSKHKHGERREKDRERDRADDRHKKKHEEFRIKNASRMLLKHHRDKRPKEEDEERMRKERLTRRDLSSTPSPDEILMGSLKKRERSPPERMKKKDKPKEAKKHDPLSSAVPSEQATVTVAKMEVIESVAEEEETFIAESEITSFTLDSPAGPQKYSKFDSSPEPGGTDEQTPEHSPVAVYSDVEMEPEPEFDPSTATYETLTDEQKALLSPDTKKRLENEWQSRLIAQLPIYYASFMGCRNVVEFDCVNRVEEGTFGVVYRAKNKRTDEIVALKRLKIEKEREGFPITALREINMLLKAGKHENIVNVQEILIGSNADKIYLAMEFVEHDMKNLMDTMHKRGKRFSQGEQKTLMRQLLSGLKHLHDSWILHRDLKTSNLLFSHKGILKIADFGLAREYGDPLRPYTAVVVTLWYRAPELLLGQKLYSTPIDLWSVGCIMGEFVLLKPLFPGNGELDEINKIFTELGTPSDSIWEGYSELPGPKMMKLGNYPYNQLRKKFHASIMNESGFKLLNRFLTYDPKRRITAEEALNDKWFTEDPKPTPPEMFPTFPAKSEQHRAPPPKADKANKKAEIINPERAKLLADLKVRPDQVSSGSFSLKFDKTRF